MNNLAQLEARIAKELHMIGYPEKNWVIPRSSSSGKHVYDVLIVGAGQSGLTAAFGLLQERINNILVVDREKSGFEGVWINFARMHTLRSPKYSNGPDLDIPCLTFQSWFEAQHGESAWENLDKIATIDWHHYLQWYRKVLQIPVLNNITVVSIQPTEEDLIELTADNNGSDSYILARKVVLATGEDGNGSWHIPDIIKDKLPITVYSNCANKIDFSLLKNKEIAILGGSSTAYDNASTALENGAANVHIFHRRSTPKRLNPYIWTEFNGFLNNIHFADDIWRWRIMKHIVKNGEPVPNETFMRTIKHSNVHLHFDSAWEDVNFQNNQIYIKTQKQQFVADYVLVAVGTRINLSLRPELSKIKNDIALWNDRYSPPIDEADQAIGQYPYLGEHFEFTEKVPGKGHYLKNIHNFSFGATFSHGPSAAILGMKHATRKLVRGISKDFFIADIDKFHNELKLFNEEGFTIAMNTPFTGE